ncbi:translation machinery-associated protein 16 [Penicillium ochrochloron]
MPSVSLSKVHKNISKKRGSMDSMHENSRDAKRLRRAGSREERLSHHASMTLKARQPYLERIHYFHEAVQSIEEPLSDDQLSEMILKCIHRDEEEIAQLKSERRKGRPPTRREELLNQRTETEEKEFKTGFWLPELGDADVLHALKHWNRHWAGLSSLKFIRITQEGLKQASSFPPKGMS